MGVGEERAKNNKPRGSQIIFFDPHLGYYKKVLVCGEKVRPNMHEWSKGRAKIKFMTQIKRECFLGENSRLVSFLVL